MIHSVIHTLKYLCIFNCILGVSIHCEMNHVKYEYQAQFECCTSARKIMGDGIRILKSALSCNWGWVDLWVLPGNQSSGFSFTIALDVYRFYAVD
ncbi:hypothetical protein VNO80_15331 [Phaseolus coccineus]|uniref:Secreted protein n=1 Tax=Phaseolus coccineus TaxID=3886 RepID=A0AAN9MK35_PHACN